MKSMSDVKKDEYCTLSSVIKPSETIVLGMEIACRLFRVKPGEQHMNIKAGDPEGYFWAAKKEFLNEVSF